MEASLGRREAIGAGGRQGLLHRSWVSCIFQTHLELAPNDQDAGVATNKAHQPLSSNFSRPHFCTKTVRMTTHTALCSSGDGTPTSNHFSPLPLATHAFSKLHLDSVHTVSSTPTHECAQLSVNRSVPSVFPRLAYLCSVVRKLNHSCPAVGPWEHCSTSLSITH